MTDLILGLSFVLGLGCVSTRLAQVLRVPHSVLLVVLGVLGGLVARGIGWKPPQMFWHHFPEVVLYILLPPLVFESAYHLDLQALRRDRWPLILLSTGGLVCSCLVIGTLLHGSGLPWSNALLFGALISATDPVAVVAIFREVGGRERLTTLLEGESLLNDGTAIVLFRVLLGAALGAHSPTVSQGVQQFVTVSLGGVVVGLALFWFFVKCLAAVADTSASAQVGLTVSAAYVSYLLADHVLGVSGVLATMALGLSLGHRARLTLNRDALHSMHGIWEFFALAANTAIFLAVGLSVDRDVLLSVSKLLPVTMMGVFLARVLSVGLSFATVQQLRLCRPISPAEQAVMIWGGLRGGLALALVLTIPDSFLSKSLFLGLATAVVLCSLLLNALTVGPMLRALGLSRLTERERAFLSLSLHAAYDKILRLLRRTADDGGLSLELLAQVGHRAQPPLEGDLDPFDFSVRRHLSSEQAYYDEELESGALSTPAYLILTRWVASRLQQLDGEPAELIHFAFEFDAVVNDHLRLEILLHLGLGLRQTSASEVESLRLRWLNTSHERLEELQSSHPQLVLAVQSKYLAHALANSARANLLGLLQHSVINRTVYAQALRDVGTLQQELLEDARRLANPSFRETLERTPLFANLPDFVLGQIEAWSSRRKFAPGEMVVRAGEHGRSFFVVISGVLEVDGSATRLFAGAFFGELSLLFGTPRTADVTAVVESELVEIESLIFYQIQVLCPEFKARVREVARQRALQAGIVHPELSGGS